MNTLLLVLRDQLSRSSAALEALDPARDAVAMTEADVHRGPFPEHKQRLALGWAAMRHFRDDLRAQGYPVHYEPIDAADRSDGAAAFLRRRIERHRPSQVRLIEPGRAALRNALVDVCEETGVSVEVWADDHFLVTHRDFEAWADGRKQLTLEYFYREQRRRHDVLMTEDGEPVGGEWNYDDENREAFGPEGPGLLPDGPPFERDELTETVLDRVRTDWADAPGTLDDFRWPVTPAQAETALEDFVEHRLPQFGTYQDAMWIGRAFLYHSRLSAALNLRLLDPLAVVRRAEEAYHTGHAPLNAVEGFVRQVLGWREFVRGVYWLHAPEYPERNALDAGRELPDFYWTADTDMQCLSDCVGQVREHGYTHHIPRLMVIGLFGLLYGVDPQQMNAWHEAMYVDAWEWVSAPNMIGMALYADGGIVGTKPYTASGKYIDRMSNYCSHCRYDPEQATGDDACPFTSLYWHFLDRHRERFASNPRMNFQLANVRRKDDEDLQAIAERVDEVRSLAAEGAL